jgi:hypothetical protein
MADIGFLLVAIIMSLGGWDISFSKVGFWSYWDWEFGVGCCLGREFCFSVLIQYAVCMCK